MDWITPIVIAEAALIWFAIKTYIDYKAAMGENARKDEKIAELKEFIKDSK